MGGWETSWPGALRHAHMRAVLALRRVSHAAQPCFPRRSHFGQFPARRLAGRGGPLRTGRAGADDGLAPAVSRSARKRSGAHDLRGHQRLWPACQQAAERRGAQAPGPPPAPWPGRRLRPALARAGRARDRLRAPGQLRRGACRRLGRARRRRGFHAGGRAPAQGQPGRARAVPARSPPWHRSSTILPSAWSSARRRCSP